MNSSAIKTDDKGKIAVELTPNEALALTGVEFNDNQHIKASAQRKIRDAFERTFEFQAENR
ncbi:MULTISPECIES: hypothetical protein [Paenibacillus]|uniref:Uncharacterized protein n=1 Tax=Paenibacillus campinasensis TaxID=66347 RepID=A0A268EDM8_9BACL|nr:MULTISPECIES: hypothetical protein [Paenibacillus]MUG66040.1 hypothetical protein [Paenibacillus campinasensis]PAD71225.1 hypothetical protein CHH67_25215 [Paenibacillus campinasensis]PAK49804.1 hypothetical protein CHH75_19695 [Paenibacillus sp. 7541]